MMSRLFGAVSAGLFVFIAVSVSAAFIGRLPFTPGGSDFRAYYDDQLNVTWAWDANNNGGATWDNQVAWAAGLTIDGVGGWRLPNMDVNGDSTIIDCKTAAQVTCKDNEFGHLYYFGAGTVQGNGVTSNSQSPFVNIQAGFYWAGTLVPNVPTNARGFHFGTGIQSSINKNNGLPGWAVHPGDVAVLRASILPGKRTVQVGATATAFATILNISSEVATSCSIAPATTVDATFLYQTTDPATNALTGSANTPVDIAAGAFQTYVFAFTPNSAFAQTSILLTFDCTDTAGAPTGVVNTFSLGASATPVPDIIALAATTQNDGIVHLPTTAPDIGVFSVASINIGAPGMIDVSGDTGTAALPVGVSVCETNPLTAACINPVVPSGNSMRQYATNETATHSFFVDPSDAVALDPGNSRVFANFLGAGNSAEGVTSVALEGGVATGGQ